MIEMNIGDKGGVTITADNAKEFNKVSSEPGLRESMIDVLREYRKNVVQPKIDGEIEVAKVQAQGNHNKAINEDISFARKSGFVNGVWVGVGATTAFVTVGTAINKWIDSRKAAGKPILPSFGKKKDKGSK